MEFLVSCSQLLLELSDVELELSVLLVESLQLAFHFLKREQFAEQPGKKTNSHYSRLDLASEQITENNVHTCICSFIALISFSRGSICFFSSLIL